ncbi:hypothetical protein TNCV_3339521, partial [Trichonephila clavipes]
YTRALGDGPSNLEPWSSDEDDSCELAPPLLISTPTGERLSFDRVNAPLHGGSSAVLGSNS